METTVANEIMEVTNAQIELPTDLWREFRSWAALNGIPAKKAAAMAFREFLDRSKSAEQR